MKKIAAAVIIIFAAALAACLSYDYFAPKSKVLKIYGSVDLRTINLAFLESGRIAETLVDEGASLKAGDTVARLTCEKQEIALSQAVSQRVVAAKELDLALAGSRKEEIAASRAKLAAANASLELSRRTCRRETRLGDATSQQKRDEACFEAKVDEANRDAAARDLDLLLAGTRIESIEVTRASLALAETQESEAKRAVRDCVLKAPSDSVVRSRLREKGDMVTSSTTVYELAVMTPLWVRAWVDESNLGRVKEGGKVSVTVDSFPGKVYEGTIGFVSTVAEFTPKTVQTEDLRTALVYEVRVTVNDPERGLRLGMPATVTFEDPSSHAP